MKSTLVMVQEGDVLDLTNNGETATVRGALAYTDGFVGAWNAGGVAPDKAAALVVRGVIETSINGGIGGISKGTRVSLNVETGELEVAAAGAVWDMAEPDEDNLITFGTTVTAVAAGATKKVWVSIKPQ